MIRAGDAFHRAVASLERPSFIGRTDDPWSRADRMVWGEEVMPREPILDRLTQMFRPVSAPSQLIHGDLLGNVLFAPGQPPTVIDWALYWRPAGLSAAIAAVDAVCWHAWPTTHLKEFQAAEWEQLLVRAMAFRITTLHLLKYWNADLAERHAPVIEVIADLHH